jgi:hypothetical protein
VDYVNPVDDRLNGPGEGVLRDLLRRILTSPDRAQEFLKHRLDCNYHDFPGDDLRAKLGGVVEDFNAQPAWRDLLAAARNAAPRDAALQAFEEAVGQAPRVVDASPQGGGAPLAGRELERKIKAGQETFDVAVWRSRLGEMESRVCRIELPEGTARGTGFLIGPDLVLTNYHVIEQVKPGGLSPTSLAFRFDYKAGPDGIAVGAGQVYRCAEDWLAASSPYSPQDLTPTPSADPSANELDFAVLRLSGRAGEDPKGGPTNDPVTAPRGWIRPGAPHAFNSGQALYILQHPDGKPMQLGLDTDAVLEVNGNGTRVRYTVTTEPGSSGSPVFSADWEWVALHHSGDPRATLKVKPGYNEGVPVAALLGCAPLKALIEAAGP